MRDLVARREPLIAFALRSTLADYDLDTAEGRVRGAGADRAAGGQDQGPGAAARIRPPAGRAARPATSRSWPRLRRLTGDGGGGPRRGPAARAPPDDPAVAVEREALKLACRCPELAGPSFDAVRRAPSPTRTTRRSRGGRRRRRRGRWRVPAGVARRDRRALRPGVGRAMLTALAVEPLRSVGEADSAYVNAVLARLQELATVRRVAALKGKLQRMNPVEAPTSTRRSSASSSRSRRRPGRCGSARWGD